MIRKDRIGRRVTAFGALTLAAALALGGCAGGSEPTADGAKDTGSQTVAEETTLTVFAAASLRDVLEPIADEFEADNPGVTVTFSFAGSSDLVSQLAGGAPADVLITADEKNMTKAEDNGDIEGTPDIVATNTLVMVTQPGNPKGITGLDDTLDGKDLVVCAPQVPCGTASQTLAGNLGITLTPVSEENSVTDVLGKVTAGQADAGLVYATDAIGAGEQVTTVEIPGAEEVVNRYPAAAIKGSVNAELAKKFVEMLQESVAQKHLADAGFGTP